MTARYLTPLRYPGGKAKLGPLVWRVMASNDLLGGDYLEPYAGGASVAWILLLNDVVSRVHINDLDPSIYSFWHSVLNEPEGLCRLIRNKRVSVAEWKRQQAVLREQTDASHLERGFSTFFLNRTNRSGIICSGGMIGGAKQQGQWKLDARYNKTELIERIERIAAMRERVILYRQDAAVLLRHLLPTLPPKSFVYLDPPYYVKGRRRLYANFYEHKDHSEIASIMRTSHASWMVSYDNTPEIRALYKDFRNRNYRLSYIAKDRYDGQEVLFFSDGLKIPPIARHRPISALDHATKFPIVEQKKGVA